MAGLACRRFLDDGQQTGLKGAVGIVTSLTIITHHHFPVSALLKSGMTIKAEFRDAFRELVLRF